MTTESDNAIVASLFRDTKTVVSDKYFCETRPFASPQPGNKATICRDGATAFGRIYDAIVSAKTFVFIIDWQLSIDFELKRPPPGTVADETHPFRLSELLARKVTDGVDIRILLYDAPSNPFSTNPSLAEADVPTYDDAVARILNELGQKLKAAGAPGSLICIQHGPTSAQFDSIDYSHHQKMVLVDGRVGFLGGMDMTNGRWDTIEFDCVVNPERFVLNDMYNPCLVRARKPSAGERKLTKPLLGGAAKALRIRGKEVATPGFAFAQYDEEDGFALEPGCQPRMPWQDVHVMLEGPALADMYRNFVRRLDGYITLDDVGWGYVNARDQSPQQQSFRRQLKRLQTSQTDLDRWRNATAANAVAKGNAYVQILRSVSNRQLQGEAYRLDDLRLHAKPATAKLWEEAVMAWKGEHQDNIYQAMLACIRAAKAYIYIETQFLISGHGGLSNTMIDNRIVNALAGKVIDMANHKIPFHVYIVLPVHPEGAPTNAATYKQQRLALNSIAHGSESLFKKIEQETGRLAKDFVTVLNLRTHGVLTHYARDPRTGEQLLDHEIGRYVVTEQIYVHSKLLIVDDAVAIIGSANTNDRSLTGNGDSEIAAVIVDNEDVRFEDLGNGNKVHTRKFARELRIALWRKHLGMDLPDEREAPAIYHPADWHAEKLKKLNADRVPHPPRQRPADDDLRRFRTWLDRPAAETTWRGIQSLAKGNTSAYEAVFPHIPSNRLPRFDSGLVYFPDPQRVRAEEVALARRLLAADYESLQQQRNLSGVAREDARSAAASSIDAQMQTNVRRYPGDPGLADLSGIPPVLTPLYLRPKKSFQQRLPYYLAYKVSLRGEPPQELVHDCEKAMGDLRGKVKGFWVEAPLQWGQQQSVWNPYTAGPGVDLTFNSRPSSEPAGNLASGTIEDQSA